MHVKELLRWLLLLLVELANPYGSYQHTSRIDNPKNGCSGSGTHDDPHSGFGIVAVGSTRHDTIFYFSLSCLLVLPCSGAVARSIILFATTGLLFGHTHNLNRYSSSSSFDTLLTQATITMLFRPMCITLARIDTCNKSLQTHYTL